MEIVYGHGGGGQTLVPSFEVGEGGCQVLITPPIYRYPPFRHMRPDTLSIPAHEEVLYGTYTIGYLPEGRVGKGATIWAEFEYADRDRRETSLRLRTKPIPFPNRKAR